MAAIESQAAGSCKYLPTLHVTRLLNAWRRATRTSVRSTAASRIGQHGAIAQLRAVVARGHAHAWCFFRRRALVRPAPNCRYALLVRTKRQSGHGSSAVLCCRIRSTARQTVEWTAISLPGQRGALALAAAPLPQRCRHGCVSRRKLHSTNGSPSITPMPESPMPSISVTTRGVPGARGRRTGCPISQYQRLCGPYGRPHVCAGDGCMSTRLCSE